MHRSLKTKKRVTHVPLFCTCLARLQQASSTHGADEGGARLLQQAAEDAQARAATGGSELARAEVARELTQAEWHDVVVQLRSSGTGRVEFVLQVRVVGPDRASASGDLGMILDLACVAWCVDGTLSAGIRPHTFPIYYKS